jgi:transposase
VRSFPTVTAELHRLADWLTACGVTTVAMESTGVYWIPLYEILGARGFDVVLVNAHHMKNDPGRKTDVVDTNPSLTRKESTRITQLCRSVSRGTASVRLSRTPTMHPTRAGL